MRRPVEITEAILPKGNGGVVQRRWKELETILEKWTRFIGRLVMEGECPG